MPDGFVTLAPDVPPTTVPQTTAPELPLTTLVSELPLTTLAPDNHPDKTTLPLYTVTIEFVAHCTVVGTASNGEQVAEGSTITLTAIPDSGYRLTGWVISGTSYSITTSLTWDITTNSTFSALVEAFTVTADIPISLTDSTVQAAWSSMAALSNTILDGSYLPGSVAAADVAAFAYASSADPSILTKLPAGVDLVVSGVNGAAMAASMASRSLNGVAPALPIRAVTPDVTAVIPAPTVTAGSYYIAVPKTVSKLYTFANSTDTLTVDGPTGVQVFTSGPTGIKTTLTLGATYTYTPLVGPVVNVSISYLGSSAGGTSGSVVCFLADAPVLTPSGYKPIASLRIGDRVKTANGASSRIQRISKQNVVPSATTNPYKIPKGLYGAKEELLISPNHHVLANGKLVEARHLGLQQKTMKKEFTYYNLELESWTNMIVAGVTVESLAPVQRITVTMAEFTKMIEVRYGPMTAALEQKIKATCRFLADGRVELPAISTKNVTARRV